MPASALGVASGGTPIKKAGGAGSRGASPLRTAGSPAPAKAKPRAGTPLKEGSAAKPAAASKGGAAGKKRPPSAPAPGSFIASKKWDGPRDGMVFQNGPHGVGYYLDPSGSSGSGAGASSSSARSDVVSSAREEVQLDAADVFATLPMTMQVAFEARDIAALDAALAALPPAEAEVHMKRCVASGLWDPDGAGGKAASYLEQEPSPTGESDAPGGSAASSPSATSDGGMAADAAAEEAAAEAEAAALEQRAAASGASASNELFERGPYRAGSGGPKSDAPKKGGSSSSGGKADDKPSPPARKGRAAAGSSSTAGKGADGPQLQALQEQLETMAASLRVEQQARAAAEAEVQRAQTQVQRLLEKLDAAERFKSDEARAMSAASDVQKRLQQENEQLRRQLAATGADVPPPAEAQKGADAAAEADAAAAASSSAFDADIVAAENVAELGFPPASLDPDEVLLSLPQSMQAAFDALDVQALHASLAALPPAEASEYMRRCVASGLWDPNGPGGDA